MYFLPEPTDVVENMLVMLLGSLNSSTVYFQFKNVLTQLCKKSFPLCRLCQCTILCDLPPCYCALKKALLTKDLYQVLEAWTLQCAETTIFFLPVKTFKKVECYSKIGKIFSTAKRQKRPGLPR